MSDRALTPSALASFLFDLAKRGFDGSFELGGRTVVLEGGLIVDVGAADGDESIAQFLVDAGRIERERALSIEASAGGDPGALSRLLAEAIGREDVVRTAQRATWLDRMVRSLEAADLRGETQPRVRSGLPVGTSAGLRLELPLLLLDALSRRAGERDAGLVGERAGSHFALTPKASVEIASRWAGFTLPDEPTPVFKLLAKSPAAAARLAAFVRAGWARIGTPDELRSMPSEPPPEHAPFDEPEAAPSRALSTILPEPSFALDDPIEPLERSVRELTDAGAPPAEVAHAYRKIARVWETELFAVEEAARAYREAAAVDPADFEALSGAARLCRSLGRHDLSRAYAEAALAIAEGPELDAALQSAIVARLRTGDEAAVIEGLAALAHARAHDGDTYERLARAMASAGDVDGALESGLRAFGIYRERQPERARYIVEWLGSLAPDRDDLLGLHTDVLGLEGYGRAATALLAMAALETSSVDERRARLSAAAERAELERRSDLAADLLARAFDDEPGLDILHEPLAAVSSAANAPEAHAVMLESIALATDHDRGAHLAQAAKAFAALPGGRPHAFELAVQALIDAPESASAETLVAELASSREELEEAHERARTGARERARDHLRDALARADDDALSAGLELSGLAAIAGDHAESCDAALAVLEIESRHPLALARAERAARHAKDTARMERAFDAGLRAGPGTRERSRLLVHLAILASVRRDEVTAVNRALEAIRVDPSCAEAYLLLMRRLDHIPTEGLGGVVDRARAALGDSALILRRAIDVAGARGQERLVMRLREARAHMSDLGPDALRARLALAAFSPDPGVPRGAIRDALEVPDVIEQALDELLAALERLLELDPKSAARLALAAIDRHGEGSFVPLAHRAALEAEDSQRIVAALERVAAWGRGPAKARALLEIASRHREEGFIPGEHRVLLRLLSVAPRDAEALERLVTLYASTGELERLEAALSLAVESTDDPTLRAVRTVQLARARLRDGRDPAGAVAALEHLLSDCGAAGNTPLEALPFAGEIFELFDEASLELGDEAKVHAFYGQLEEHAMGRHARRGLIARRARLLERLGRYEPALEHYVRTFSLEPSPGGALEAIERLGGSLGEDAIVADAWLTLASRTDDADEKVSLVVRASERFEEIGDLARATDEMCGIYEQTNRLELLPRLFDLARRGERERRDEIAEIVASKLEDRVDGSWDFADQLRCLERMVDAELLRERPEAASHAANRASELAKTEDDVDHEALAALHSRLASHFDDSLASEPARHHAARALEHRPGDPSARALLDRLGEPPSTSSAPRPSVAVSTLPKPVPPRQVAQTASAPPKMDHVETRELISALISDPAQPAIWLVLSEADDGGSGVRQVAAAVRAAFEHEPPPIERPFESPCPVGLPLLEEREALVDALLRTLERTVLPIVPRTAEELGREPRGPVEADDPRPAARAFHALASTTGIGELSLFVHEGGSSPGVVTTEPPGIALAAWVEENEAQLPFCIARLLALACPGSLLVGTRTSLDDLELLFGAVSLAFAASPTAEETRADIVSLASRLKRELSIEAQDEIGAWLSECPLPPAAEIHELVHRRAASLSLLHTGTLHAAITRIFEEEPTLVAHPPRGLESLYAASKGSRTLTELLELALDPAFAAMYREHTLGS